MTLARRLLPPFKIAMGDGFSAAKTKRKTMTYTTQPQSRENEQRQELRPPECSYQIFGLDPNDCGHFEAVPGDCQRCGSGYWTDEDGGTFASSDTRYHTDNDRCTACGSYRLAQQPA